MMPLDVDPDTLTRVPVPALIAQAVADQPVKAVKVETILYSGQSVEQDGGSHSGDGEYAQGRMLNPGRAAVEDLTSSGWLARNRVTKSKPKVTAVIETAPLHGRLEALPNGEFRYTPKKGFLGKDFLSFILDIEGKKIRRNYELHIVEDIEEPKAQIRTPIYLSLTAQGQDEV